MSEQEVAKPVTPVQVIGILASTLALFFMVAFATKSLDAYRLRLWRARLRTEIADMTRARSELEEEIRQRDGTAWVEGVLRDAGQVPEGVTRVDAEAVTSQGAVQPTVESQPADRTPAALQGGQGLFDNPNWRAWQRLLWGFD